jgi:uncharacterized protein YndB with AHSA1/START domain
MVAHYLAIGYLDVQPNVAEQETDMEQATIEREIQIEAAPDVVFDVISNPVHIREWWNGAEMEVEPASGATGELVWGDRAAGDASVVQITVVEAVPPRLFSFRWVHRSGEVATATNSLLVTFELQPAGAGTVLRVTESGWREIGWEVAVLEAAYKDHCDGWDTYVAGIGEYANRLAATS